MSDRPDAAAPENPFAAEAQERWGHTEAYKESRRRTRDYSEEDWARIRSEMEAIEARFAALLASGASPEGDEAMGVAEEARVHIDRNFYPCSHEMHAALGEMYTADERFRAHYEDRAEGLADFVSAAIGANAPPPVRGPPALDPHPGSRESRAGQHPRRSAPCPTPDPAHERAHPDHDAGAAGRGPGRRAHAPSPAPR